MSWNYLGTAYAAMGKPFDAVRALRRALSATADVSQVLKQMAAVGRNFNLRTIETWSLRRLIAIDPRPEYMHALGLSLCYSGLTEAGIRQFRKMLLVQPSAAIAQSGIAMGCQMVSSFHPLQVYEEHCRWDLINSRDSYSTGPALLRRRGNRPLRVGYISGQFTDCSHSFFFEPILEGHSPDRIQSFCYSNSQTSDGITRRLRTHAYRWRNILGCSDDIATDLIRRDRIDILVDLDGHANGNRLTLFARKPVARQLTYLGYPNTTGLGAMDYRITDSMCDPPGETEHYHTETLLRLDPCFLNYRPPADAPPVRRQSTSTTGSIVFACFNSMSKIPVDCLQLFADVLAAVPDSRLLLKCQSLYDPTLVRRILRFFAARGVAETRISPLAFATTRFEHLLRYQQADIALDSTPYVGTTTTCEALWMGVPVVSLVGKTHVQRVGKTLLNQAGLPELAVNTRTEFVAAAARLAAQRSRLAEVRENLRAQLQKSDLLQGEPFVRRFEDLLIRTVMPSK
ncbi:MAG TPA: hypothetical protein VFQ91_20425 [Bryobacteraceae bacterium]|nr:hypothetical protein [Bryobacteraceae bacterium]